MLFFEREAQAKFYLASFSTSDKTLTFHSIWKSACDFDGNDKDKAFAMSLEQLTALLLPQTNWETSNALKGWMKLKLYDFTSSAFEDRLLLVICHHRWSTLREWQLQAQDFKTTATSLASLHHLPILVIQRLQFSHIFHNNPPENWILDSIFLELPNSRTTPRSELVSSFSFLYAIFNAIFTHFLFPACSFTLWKLHSEKSVSTTTI